MTVRHLTQEWLDRYLELAADLPEAEGASAVLEHVVAKTPDGDVTYVVRWEDGRPVEARLGPADGADPDEVLRLSIAYPEAQAMARGELDLPTGFMQGRVKLVGSTGRFLALQGALQSDAHRAALAALAADTEV